jgi:hypothetical protein
MQPDDQDPNDLPHIARPSFGDYCDLQLVIGVGDLVELEIEFTNLQSRIATSPVKFR